MDFMHDVLENGRKVRILNIIDDYNREAIAQEVAYSQNSESVIRTLENLIIERDEPLRIRTDNGPEFISKVFQEWCSENDIINSYTQPGKPTQNAYIERFNRTYREDILDAYLFENIEQLRLLTQQFRLDYNENHPHKSLGGLSPIKYAMNSGKLSKFTTIHSLTG
jgi:putative transposase